MVVLTLQETGFKKSNYMPKSGKIIYLCIDYKFVYKHETCHIQF